MFSSWFLSEGFSPQGFPPVFLLGFILGFIMDFIGSSFPQAMSRAQLSSIIATVPLGNRTAKHVCKQVLFCRRDARRLQPVGRPCACGTWMLDLLCPALRCYERCELWRIQDIGQQVQWVIAAQQLRLEQAEKKNLPRHFSSVENNNIKLADQY